MAAAKDVFVEIGVTDPAYSNAAAIAPNDSTPLGFVTRGIYVGGTGDVTVTMKGGQTTITFKAVPVGTVLRVRASLVNATGTSATNLVALW